ELTRDSKILSKNEGKINKPMGNEGLDVKTVNYVGLIPVMIEAIKEQQKETETKQPTQDVGSGQLVGGKAHIDMHSAFAQNISDINNVRVFIQLQGDCKGVYVTNITSTGFDVVELNGGTSDVKFFWQAISGTTN